MATSYTYDDYLDFSTASGYGHIYTASSGGTVFSANRKDSTAFDYFANNCQVNDAIYFGYELPRRNFGDIKLYIGTAFAATSVTFVWEYSKTGSTWATLTVTDGTSNFTNTGECIVSFTHPTDSYYALVNGIYSDWIRCRITAVNTPTEGGAQSTQKVYAKSRGVHIVDAGNTVSNFCAGAYAADVAGGWGVVQKIGSYSYLFNCHVFLGDASNLTHISDTLKNIEFSGVVKGMKAGCIITLGTLNSATYKSTKDGCSVYFNKTLQKSFAGSGDDIWKLYSSVLLSGSPYGTAVLYNTVFGGSLYTKYVSTSTGPAFYNTYFSARPDFITYTQMAGSVADRVTVGATTYTLRATFACYLKNLTNLDCTYLGQNDSATNEYDLVLIDAQTNTYDIYWESVSTRGNYVGINYTFNLKVVDEAGNPISGATVYLTDTNGYSSLFTESGLETSAVAKTNTSFTFNTNVWSVGDYLRIGCEVVKIDSGSYPTYTCSRSQQGTSAGYHGTRQVLKQNQTLTTDANGQISECICQANRLSYGSGSHPGVTTNTSYSPFTLTISKSGYKTYKSKFTLSNKFNEIITLQKVKNLNLSKSAKIITQ